MSAAPSSLRQERHKPVFVPSTIKIEADIEHGVLKCRAE